MTAAGSDSAPRMLCLARAVFLDNSEPTFKNQEISHKYLNFQNGLMIPKAQESQSNVDSSVAAPRGPLFGEVLALPRTHVCTRWTSSIACQSRTFPRKVQMCHS